MDSTLPSDLRTRFAPTPSGYLHLGNAFSFLFTWLFARKHNGNILLRIDDLDSARKRPEYVEDIFMSLDWLGLDYDDGPHGPDDFDANHSQRHRRDLYQAELEKLRQTPQLFACNCTRSSISNDNNGGLHPDSCRQRNIDLDANDVAWRMETEHDARVSWQDADQTNRSVVLHTTMKDFVVRRKDGVPAYQITSVADDVHFAITHIVRGQDLLESTAAQLWLSRHMGRDRYAETTFLHHVMIPDEDGMKLSKSTGATSLRAIRERETTPEQTYRKLSRLLGLPEAATSAIDALAMWTP